MTLLRVRISTLSLLVLFAACKDEKPAAVDSAATPVAVPEAAIPPAVNPGWDESAAGPAMFLSVAENSAAAFVVLPFLTDSAVASANSFQIDSLSNTPVELFSRAGLAGSSTLIVNPAAPVGEGCVTWPQARLSEIPSKPWRVGFVRGTVSQLPVDSLEAMKPEDSASVTREIARLSSMVAEGDDPAFRGLPFSVRKAYRFSLPDISVLAGDVVRKINEEANPREEHLLVVAERAAAATVPYSAVFHTRVAGSEEAVRTNEILGAVQFVRSKRPALIVSFDYSDGGRVALLQRMNNSEWKITWRSAYTGC